MRKQQQHSIVALYGLCLVLPALVVCSALPPSDAQPMNKLELETLEQPNNIANNPDNKIIGGSTAAAGQFPYMVSLRRDMGNDDVSNFCGGSIISDRWILTAAHCFSENSTLLGLTAVVGTNKLNESGVAHQVESIHIHEFFKSSTLVNDIALIRVITPIVFSSNVQRIRLALLNPSNGTTATLSGWGLVSYIGEADYLNELQYIDLQTIDLATCANRLQNAVPFMPITPRHLCTTSPVNHGLCFGDFGGPLVVSGVQVGIASHGIPCARGYPDVFTSVASFRLWIFLKINNII